MRNASFLDIEITANSNDNSQSQLCDHQSRRMKLSTYMSSGKKGDPGYSVLCRISYYAKQWYMEECTWQGVFCLHSIQFALFFSLLHPLAAGQTASIYAWQCAAISSTMSLKSSMAKSSSFHGAPRCQFHRSQGKHSGGSQGGPLITIVIHMEFYFTPTWMAPPTKKRVPGGHFAPIISGVTWWFQPIWKTNWKSSPNRGENKKKKNHHLLELLLWQLLGTHFSETSFFKWWPEMVFCHVDDSSSSILTWRFDVFRSCVRKGYIWWYLCRR